MKSYVPSPAIPGDIYKSSGDWRTHPPVFEKVSTCDQQGLFARKGPRRKRTNTTRQAEATDI